MKICRIAHALPPVLGGLEQHAAELSVRQAQGGHQVHLVFARGETPVARNVFGHRVNLPVSRPSEKSTLRQLRFILRALALVRRLVVTRKIDLIDVHGDFVEAFFVGLVGRWTGTPTVLTVQAGLNERAAARVASALAFSVVGHFVAVSEAIRRQLLERGVDAGRISVITNAVDVARFSKPATTLPHAQAGLMEEFRGRKIILFAGRLHQLKGVEVLLRAVPLVTEKLKDAVFVIGGDGPEAGRLKKLAADLPNVRFTGLLESSVVSALMSRATLFVYPSVPQARQDEGTPRAILEAMAAGLPVVATRSGGIAELVEENRGGKLVTPWDAEELAKALIAVLSDSALAREMGAHNQKVIESKDYSIIERQVTALFERLVREQKR